MSRRILVTGARKWIDVERVAFALSHHMRIGDTLVHGAAVDEDGNPAGLDDLAARMWAPFGPVEAHRAADFPTPLARNLHMIDLGAVLCLTFALRWGSGTGHCGRHARKAGILTFDYGVDTSSEARPMGRR